jgi:hypothetical protein
MAMPNAVPQSSNEPATTTGRSQRARRVAGLPKRIRSLRFTRSWLAADNGGSRRLFSSKASARARPRSRLATDAVGSLSLMATVSLR